MSMPTLRGTLERQHARLIRMARVQVEANTPEMSKHPRKADGTFAPKSEIWVRRLAPDDTEEERHLPHLLGSVELVHDHEIELLRSRGTAVVVGLITILAAWLWILLGWGLAGAASLVLAVAFYRRLFADAS